MTFSVKAVKSTARTVLKGNWVASSISSLLPIIFFFASEYFFEVLKTVFFYKPMVILLTVIFLSLNLFLGFPLILGTVRSFWRIANGESADISENFYFFSSSKRYFKAFSFIILFFGRIILISFVLLLPSLIIEFISNGNMGLLFGFATPLWMTNFYMVAILLRIVAVLFIIFMLLSQYLSIFIFAVNDDIDPLVAIHLSGKASSQSVGGFVSLFFSMLFWILISFLVAPAVFTLPYIIMTYVVHCRFACVAYNMKQQNKIEFGGGAL